MKNSMKLLARQLRGLLLTGLAVGLGGTLSAQMIQTDTDELELVPREQLPKSGTFW